MKNTWPKALAVTALAGGVALGGAGLAAAADGTATPTPSATSSADPSASPSDGAGVDQRKSDRQGRQGGRHGGHGWHGGDGWHGWHGGHGALGMFGGRGALHGEAVVKNSDGAYTTVATQTGQVTAVSETSLEVKSEDGYSRTYAITAEALVNSARDGIGAVEVGHTVAVVATVEGGTATAARVMDSTSQQNSRLPFGPRDRDSREQEAPGSTPAPSGGSSGSTAPSWYGGTSPSATT